MQSLKALEFQPPSQKVFESHLSHLKATEFILHRGKSLKIRIFHSQFNCIFFLRSLFDIQLHMYTDISSH